MTLSSLQKICLNFSSTFCFLTLFFITSQGKDESFEWGAPYLSSNLYAQLAIDFALAMATLYYACKTAREIGLFNDEIIGKTSDPEPSCMAGPTRFSQGFLALAILSVATEGFLRKFVFATDASPITKDTLEETIYIGMYSVVAAAGLFLLLNSLFSGYNIKNNFWNFAKEKTREAGAYMSMYHSKKNQNAKNNTMVIGQQTIKIIGQSE